jgi:hypothetical protein
VRTTFRSTYACCKRVRVLHSRCTHAARCCTRVARALHARWVRVTAVLCARGMSSAAADLIEGDERESVKRLRLADLLKKSHAACSVQHATGSVQRPQTSVRHAPRPRARQPMCVQADTWRPIGASGTRQRCRAVQDSRKVRWLTLSPAARQSSTSSCSSAADMRSSAAACTSLVQLLRWRSSATPTSAVQQRKE